MAIVTALGTVALVVVLVLIAAYHSCGFSGCPPIEQVRGYVPSEASVVVDRDGEGVGKLYRVNRVIVALDSLPEYVPQAFIATEDQEFYDHGGVDWSRAFGALWQNIRTAEIQEGFSTITMQVARNVFPERLPVQERTLNRKISEIKVARELESRYDKDEILSLYVNQIYFGSGAWGIEAAAQEYFGKSATDLSLAEATLLAGLPQAPSELNPRKDMEAALDRRRTVLRRMVDQGFITEEEAEAVRSSEPDLADSSLQAPIRGAYFMEQVRQVVERRLGDDIYTGGFTIETTLDLDAQAVAEREIERQLEAIEAGRYGPYLHQSYAAVVSDTTDAMERTTSPYLQGAVVVMSVETGDVIAMVGGRDFADSKFNRATQAERQPGSAFKPFVYAAAIQAGRPPTTRLEDTPYRVVRDGRAWAPRNYGGSYDGEITMREGLVRSKNVATIRLAEQVGISRVIDMARSLGISGDIPHYPSIAIGAAEVTLIEMVAAYAALASLGTRPEPRYVTRVTDRNGNLVWSVRPRALRVLQSDVAFVTVDLMRDVVDRGTGSAVRAVGFSQPAAGKTGTTNESADVWFIGFTPAIAAGVWIGLDEPQRIIGRATGGRLAAPVWGRIMNQVAGASGAWDPPPGVETHRVDPAGNVVGSGCPVIGELEEQYFIRGTVRPYDCREYAYRYGDSLYPDTFGPGADDSWWRRLRSRLFGDEDGDTGLAADTVPTGRADTGRLRPTPPDTAPRPLPADSLLADTTPRPARNDTIILDTARSDMPPARSDTIPRDTIPRDTIPRDTIPRDTTPPDTASDGVGDPALGG